MYICEIYDEKGDKVAETPKFEKDIDAVLFAEDMIEQKQCSEWAEGIVANLYESKLTEIQ